MGTATSEMVHGETQYPVPNVEITLITARVIEDSLSPSGKRLTTFVLTYPRFIHSEFMTHRVFSRNAASSRAIPARRIRALVRKDPALPIYWGKNKPGMQADEQLIGWRLSMVKFIVWAMMQMVLFGNFLLERLGLHKQVANRYIEPWFNITVVVTSTEWVNFYGLRNHAQAQPEIRELARVMLKAHNESIPRMLRWGEWHLPFVSIAERKRLTAAEALKVSAARCARTSYLNHEGKQSSLEEDIKLYDRLVAEEPRHASPTEHQAIPLGDPKEISGNFFGWCQNRKLIPGENLTKYTDLVIS